MRHLRIDWKNWTIPERITAVTLAACAVGLPAAVAIV
jgi:hypothetical protein